MTMSSEYVLDAMFLVLNYETTQSHSRKEREEFRHQHANAIATISTVLTQPTGGIAQPT